MNKQQLIDKAIGGATMLMDLLIIALGICGGVKSIHYIIVNYRKLKNETPCNRTTDDNQ